MNTPNSPPTPPYSVDDVKALQLWADTLYAELMNCLDHYDHADDCHLYRVPDDPDAVWGGGCDCWRSRMKIMANKYMTSGCVHYSIKTGVPRKKGKTMTLKELRKIVEELRPKDLWGKKRWTAFSRGGVFYVRQNEVSSRHSEMTRRGLEFSLNEAGVKGTAVLDEQENTLVYSPYIEFTVEQ